MHKIHKYLEPYISLCMHVCVCVCVCVCVSISVRKQEKEGHRPGVVAQTCNPSYSGGKDKEDRNTSLAKKKNIIAILLRVKWHLIVHLIHASLMTDDVMCHSVCGGHLCIFFSKGLFRFFTHF
jgi:hypothetical protein